MEQWIVLNSYKAHDFKLWLEAHLHQQHNSSPSARYSAFDFRRLGINKGESYLADTEVFFAKLENPAKESFREAIYELIISVKPDTFPPEAMADLIYLARCTEATRAINIFFPIIAKGPWGKAHRNLIYDCAGVMLAFGRKMDSEELMKIHRQYVEQTC